MDFSIGLTKAEAPDGGCLEQIHILFLEQMVPNHMVCTLSNSISTNVPFLTELDFQCKALEPGKVQTNNSLELDPKIDVQVLRFQWHVDSNRL